jgi:hypothetical protein
MLLFLEGEWRRADLQSSTSDPATAGPRRVSLYIWSTLMSTSVSLFFRDNVLLTKLENLLDKHFPAEKRPALLELEKDVALGMSFGHPFLMDGFRPVNPNFQFVGEEKADIR